METCKYGLGAGMRKPTAERRQGVLYRAYVNDYYDFGEGQGGMFVYTVGYVDGVKKQAWLVSRWKY